MSDVLIRGMKMPKSCYNCTYLHWSNFWQKYVCCAVVWEGDSVLMNGNEVKSDAVVKSGRGDNCPLVEIPSHGRLIDADALEVSIEESVEECHKWANEVDGGEMYARVSQALGTFVECDLRIKAAQTIIPAEKEIDNG